MNALSFPTDNLYKFIAILGLTSVMSGVILLFNFTDSTMNELIEIERGTHISEYDLRNLNDDSREIKKDFNIINEKYSRGEYIALQELLNLENKIENQKASIKEQNYKVVELKLNRDRLDYIREKTKEIKMIFSIMFVGGAIMMFIGFYCWYSRLQKFLDKKVKGHF